jgi:hypothetical protein
MSKLDWNDVNGRMLSIVVNIRNIVTCIPVASNGSVNTFPQHKHTTIEWRPLPDNGPVVAPSGQQKMVFSVGTVQSGCKKCSARKRLKLGGGQAYDRLLSSYKFFSSYMWSVPWQRIGD